MLLADQPRTLNWAGAFGVMTTLTFDYRPATSHASTAPGDTRLELAAPATDIDGVRHPAGTVMRPTWHGLCILDGAVAKTFVYALAR